MMGVPPLPLIPSRAAAVPSLPLIPSPPPLRPVLLPDGLDDDDDEDDVGGGVVSDTDPHLPCPSRPSDCARISDSKAPEGTCNNVIREKRVTRGIVGSGLIGRWWVNRGVEG